MGACVGWVSGVSRACGGCVRACGGCFRVCRGRVAGVSGVCWRGVSGVRCARVCRGRVAGVSRGCVGVCCPPPPLRPRGWMEAVCPGVRAPPLPWAIASACVLDAGCAVLRVSFPPRSPRDESRRALPLPSLFSASCLFVCPQGPALPSPGDVFLFSPGNQTDTDARLLFAVRAARRFYSPSPSPPHRSATIRPHTQLQISPPHRTAAHATPNFTPPLKTPPPPLGDPPHSPEWMSGVHLGGSALGRPVARVPSGGCLSQSSASSAAGWFSTAFQPARRQGGASKRRTRRCL